MREDVGEEGVLLQRDGLDVVDDLLQVALQLGHVVAVVLAVGDGGLVGLHYCLGVGDGLLYFAFLQVSDDLLHLGQHLLLSCLALSQVRREVLLLQALREA